MGATRHICRDISAFVSYEQVGDNQELYMGNSSTTKVVGQWKVVLHLSFEKSLASTEVLHVPEVQKNLVSGLVMKSSGFKLVFESNKFVITKNGVFVGKACIFEGLFKMIECKLCR